MNSTVEADCTSQKNKEGVHTDPAHMGLTTPHTHTYISASATDTARLSLPQHHFSLLSHRSPICPLSFGSTVLGHHSRLSHIIHHPVHTLLSEHPSTRLLTHKCQN